MKLNRSGKIAKFYAFFLKDEDRLPRDFLYLQTKKEDLKCSDLT